MRSRPRVRIRGVRVRVRVKVKVKFKGYLPINEYPDCECILRSPKR